MPRISPGSRVGDLSHPVIAILALVVVGPDDTVMKHPTKPMEVVVTSSVLLTDAFRGLAGTWTVR